MTDVVLDASAVLAVLNGEPGADAVWAHLPGAIERPLYAGRRRNHKSRLTNDKVRAIRSAREEGAYYSDLAKKYGVSSNAIRDIALRRTWKHVE